MTIVILSLTMADAYATLLNSRQFTATSALTINKQLYATLTTAADFLSQLQITRESAQLADIVIAIYATNPRYVDDDAIINALMIRSNISGNYERQHEKSLAQLRQAEQIIRDSPLYGPRSTKMADILSTRGHALYTMGRRDEGTDLIVESIQLFRTLKAENTVLYAAALLRAVPLTAVVSAARALDYARESMEIVERLVGANSLDYANRAYNTSSLLYDARLYEAAASYANKAIAIFYSVLGTSITLALAFVILGRAQKALGARADALQTMITARIMLDRLAGGPQHAFYAMVLEAIRELEFNRSGGDTPTTKINK